MPFPRGVTAVSLSYGYDGLANVTGITNSVDASDSKTLTYDGLDRVLTAGTASIGYNAAGNITAMTTNVNMAERTDFHLKAYVCSHVFDGSAPVLLVSRPEGDWCFLCGAEHEASSSSYRVIGIGHLFERDSTLREIQDLPADWEAERRRPGDPWSRTQLGK